jgi:hypothetical protein
MHVRVDEAGQDNAAVGVNRRGCPDIWERSDRRDLRPIDGDVSDASRFVRPVCDEAAADHNVGTHPLKAYAVTSAPTPPGATQSLPGSVSVSLATSPDTSNEFLPLSAAEPERRKVATPRTTVLVHDSLWKPVPDVPEQKRQPIWRAHE